MAESSAGFTKLIDILTRAVESGADAIEMEYDSGGTLEVCFMSGHAGAGFGLPGEEAESLTHALLEEKKKAHGGAFRVNLNGTDWMVKVKTYDHFGDNAYRLTLKPAQRPRSDSSQ